MSTPTGRLLAPQTPGPSPPSRDERSVESFASEPHVRQVLLRPQLLQTDSSSHNESFHTARTDATASPVGIIPNDLPTPTGSVHDSSKTYHLPINHQRLNGERRNWSTGQKLRASPNWTVTGELHHPSFPAFGFWRIFGTVIALASAEGTGMRVRLLRIGCFCERAFSVCSALLWWSCGLCELL